jgi:hypothetical protein
MLEMDIQEDRKTLTKLDRLHRKVNQLNEYH